MLILSAITLLAHLYRDYVYFIHRENTFCFNMLLFIGENLNNRWNKELVPLTGIIKSSSPNYETVTYLNLRATFSARLAEKEMFNYHIQSITRVILDYLLLSTPEKVNRKAASRRLYFTLDGVHLNSEGERIVADVFYKK